jgi:hypothetical protein
MRCSQCGSEIIPPGQHHHTAPGILIPYSNLYRPMEISLGPEDEVKEVFNGGMYDTRLTLEYMLKSGATEGKVQLTISGNPVFDWLEAVTADGYFFKEDFPVVQRGSRIILKVNNIISRLRWFEVTTC